MSSLHGDVHSALDSHLCAQQVEANYHFAWKLYQALPPSHNLVCAPFSLSLALAMTYAGARGHTASEMEQALPFVLAPAELHACFHHLTQAVAGGGDDPLASAPTGFTLHTLNALWAQAGYPWHPLFLEILTRFYGSDAHHVDFQLDHMQARRLINAWVTQETNARITDLLPHGAIDALTRLVLVNATYFKANWASPFQPSQERKIPFTSLSGQTVTLNMMGVQAPLSWAKGRDYTVLALPYQGRDVTMLCIMPDAGAYAAVVRDLAVRGSDNVVASLKREIVRLHMPAFQISSRFSLCEVLQGLGMQLAFGAEADFSGMDGSRELYLHDVIHTADIEVNEAGTEAAAGTAAIVQQRSAPMMAAQAIVLDRPFLFLLMHRSTGSILFMGQYVEAEGN